jgi:hypothetical protein
MKTCSHGAEVARNRKKEHQQPSQLHSGVLVLCTQQCVMVQAALNADENAHGTAHWAAHAAVCLYR